jgi:hypothetical protein
MKPSSPTTTAGTPSPRKRPTSTCPNSLENSILPKKSLLRQARGTLLIENGQLRIENDGIAFGDDFNRPEGTPLFSIFNSQLAIS